MKTTASDKATHSDDQTDKAPFFGSWLPVYGIVILFLALCIGLFYWFTATFNTP